MVVLHNVDHNAFCVHCSTWIWTDDAFVQQSFRKTPAVKRDRNRGRPQGLTDEQKQEIREAFDLFDTDGSGTTLKA